jgi:Flp pilus assembly protein TadD
MRRGITIIGIGVIVGALVAAGYHAQNGQSKSPRIASTSFGPTAQSVEPSDGDAWVTETADAKPMVDVATSPADAAAENLQEVALETAGVADETGETAGEAAASEITTPTAAATVPTAGPEQVPALVQSARALLGDGDHAAAEARALEATRVDPRSAAAWHILGRAQLARGAAVEAEASFRHACELGPANAFAANNLGYVRLLRGDWEAAREPLETAVSLRDDVAYFHNNLGVVYERLGLWDLAARAYGRAVELDPDHSRARVSLARAQSHLGPDARQLARSDTDSIESTIRFVEP